jgi:hypothetical protein
MKTCTQCRETKPSEAFTKSHGRCKKCRAGRERTFRSIRPDIVRGREKRYHGSRRRFLQAIKATCGCIDCGFREDPAQLHFDHRDDTVKLFEPSNGVFCSWSRLVTELEKCEVRCVSCHSKRYQSKPLVFATT